LFYHADNKADKWIKMGCLATEMESYALFANAAYAGKKALTLLTVSDSLVSNEETTASLKNLVAAAKELREVKDF
jgi:purine-nucleoside phosphorylase